MNGQDGIGSLFSPEAVIIFPIAVLFDILTILCTILTALFGIGAFLGIGIDIIATIIFSIWMFSRSQTMPQLPKKATKAEKKAEHKAVKKAAQKMLRKKITKRLLIAFIGSLIPIFQCFPFWTRMTYKELKSH